MAIKGMETTEVRSLAASLDVTGTALTVQGELVRGIVAKWGGSPGKLSRFPAQTTWGSGQSKDIRHRLGILGADPEYVVMMAAYLGVVKTWEWAEKNKEQIKKDLIAGAEKLQDPQLRKDALALAKGMSIGKGIAAYRRMKTVWEEAKGVRTAKSLLDLSEVFRGDYLKALDKFDEARKIYTKPWGLMSWLSKAKWLKWLNKAPGKGFLDKAFVPLSFVTGLKELVFPSHDGLYGTADRFMGLVQVAGSGAVMYGMWGGAAAAASVIPVVGWIALGAAGAYFLGSWAWDKWGDDIKSGAKTAYNWSKDKAEDGYNWSKDKVEDGYNWGKDKVEGAKDWAKNEVSKRIPGPAKKLFGIG
ncbi:hypothetical protein [Streptomyces sp. XD-27]|uniref:hypothetical protein n=1 Tax=Streptomyces sp. XD-27 TaxID=3062779 RepID=UPI0026F4623C|nr:hypothetical protein [Streptomyces sp. XD-27]WKX70976.1 hypothetical protein Q3Y56_14610 [Streptomyces sp. XD-27]